MNFEGEDENIETQRVIVETLERIIAVLRELEKRSEADNENGKLKDLIEMVKKAKDEDKLARWLCNCIRNIFIMKERIEKKKEDLQKELENLQKELENYLLEGNIEEVDRVARKIAIINRRIEDYSSVVDKIDDAISALEEAIEIGRAAIAKLYAEGKITRERIEVIANNLEKEGKHERAERLREIIRGEEA